MSNVGKVTGPPDPGRSAGSQADEHSATVRSGERSLSDVARRIGVSEDALRQANPQISNPANLSAGQAINLPTANQASPTPAQTPQSAAPQTTEAQARARGAEHDLTGQLRSAQLRNLADPSPTAESLISHRTGFLSNLDEEGLGKDLAHMAQQDPVASR